MNRRARLALAVSAFVVIFGLFCGIRIALFNS